MLGYYTKSIALKWFIITVIESGGNQELEINFLLLQKLRYHVFSIAF